MKSWGLGLCFLISAIGAGAVLNRIPPAARPLQPPPAALLRASNGVKEIAADVLYLRFVAYWGASLTQRRDTSTLLPVLHAITDLDPRFRFAYEVGALALGDSGQTPQALELLEKGGRRAPGDWWYPYQAGMTLFFFGGDPLRAARYFERASTLSGAPATARFLAARMYERGQRKELALRVWRDIDRNASDIRIRKVSQHALARLADKEERE